MKHQAEKTVRAYAVKLLLLMFFLPLLCLASCKLFIPEDYILIYNGAAADADSAYNIAQLAQDKGYAVVYIANLYRLPDMLEGAAAFVIGGTDDDTSDLREALHDVQDDLQSYIEGGGRYLGICGGAYVASSGSQWEDGFEAGMGLVAAESFAYDSDYTDPQIITITWRGTKRTIYYQYGPAFQEDDLPENSRILASYTDDARSVAAFVTPAGSGTILLCGPHPEADESWLIDDPEPLHADLWTDTGDIFDDVFDALFEE